MGQEIDHIHFQRADFQRFKAALREETQLLRQWHSSGAITGNETIGGFELEAWLVTPDFQPAPVNEQFMEQFDSALVSPELARFNIEFNSEPRALHGDALRAMQHELQHTWDGAQQAAGRIGSRLLAIGILPTISPQHLCMANMSGMKRYRALNEQVLRLRRGQPLRLDINGRNPLQLEHHDVMMESAATSFQIHLQMPQHQAARYYNAAKIISAPMVAVSANSPFLFGHELWDETRIPLFQQAVAVTSQRQMRNCAHERVTFSDGYIASTLVECFERNLEQYEVLLPLAFEDPPQTLSHLRLHNGTIWRWNRPLVGFDAGGRPQLRLEHRVMAAGPSVIDTIANAALFYGLVHHLANTAERPEAAMPFGVARENFYDAARFGLAADIRWLDAAIVPINRLLLERLIPQAREGLQHYGIDAGDIDRYLGIIEARVQCGQNGAAWQRAWVARHGSHMQALTEAYAYNQDNGLPVHEWPV